MKKQVVVVGWCCLFTVIGCAQSPLPGSVAPTPSPSPSAASSPTAATTDRAELEAACRQALSAQLGVAAESITLTYGRSDEGGVAYAWEVAGGSRGTCRVLNNGTIDYIQTATQ